MPEPEEANFVLSLWEKGLPRNGMNEETTASYRHVFKGLKFDTEYNLSVTALKKKLVFVVDSRATGVVTVRTKKPEPPTELHGIDNGCDYVVLECEPMGHRSVVYQVRYAEEGESFVNGDSSLTPKIRVDGLKPDTMYLFQIRFISKLGKRESKWSDTIRVRTMKK